MAVEKITKSGFEKVRNEDSLKLIDFYADWCAPCKMLSPFIEEIAGEHSYLDIYKVNVDEEMELAQEFGVSSIPTIIIMRDGKVLKRTVGLSSKEELLKLLSEPE